MAFSLAVYGNNAFQESILPQIRDNDHVVVLGHREFRFQQDAAVIFENVGGLWRFSGVGAGTKVRKSGLQPGQPLKLGELIHLRHEGFLVDILITELDQSLDRLHKYAVQSPGRITIGSGSDCDIIYSFRVTEKDNLISHRHAVLEFQNGSCVVTDRSVNGVYMNCRRIQSEQLLRFGDQINIFGLQIIWLGNVIAVGTTGQEFRVSGNWLREIRDSSELYPNGFRELSGSGRQIFRRSPRIVPQLNTEPIAIDPVPQPNHPAKRPLLLTVGPSMTMVIPMMLGSLMAILAASSTGGTVSPYMFTGLVIAAAAAALGVTWALVNLRYNKKAEREAEENRVGRYEAYLGEVEAEIQAKATENRQIMEASYPPVSICASYDSYCPALWNRNASHSDMLFARLGLGDVEFQCPIEIPQKRFSLYDDPLADQPERIREQYRYLKSVPVGIDLRQRLLGIAGKGNADQAIELAASIAVQLAACCCYTDLKLAFVAEPATLRRGGGWAFARWLPHVWSESRTVRYCAGSPTERSELCYELSELLRQRAGRREDEGRALPHYVIFVENPELLDGGGFLKQLLSAEEDLGVTAVILAPRKDMLPNACERIVETNGQTGNLYDLSGGPSFGGEIRIDALPAGEAERFARRLSNVEVAEIERSGAIPDAISFLDMWGVKTVEELNVADRWRKNRTYDTMRALIGQKAGGEDWYLDIHEKHHGPHGLIAGTTGSGKSETLQTFILSLALNYSPDDVAFFIIDYKGGGMANLFESLPHMAGQISNLSGNQVHRAMVSIMSENRRRQRLFNECGVNHIDNYTRMYKNGEAQVPLPHLLLIIDEFAELKKEEAPFMRELISVAQVGRSLGVHLILATQKPSGTVDDNIWSNAKFRICLRVQDRQDSNEMLHKPDAAYITHAGRGFMQVGNDELFEEFQSGWSGADYDEDLVELGASIAGMYTITGKQAIVGNHLRKQQKDVQRQRWLLQLSGAVLEEAAAMRRPLTELASDRTERSALAARVFERLARDRVDYPCSKGNAARLEEFIGALAEQSGLRDDPVRMIGQTAARIKAGGGKLPEIKVRTQLAAVVDHLAHTAAENGYDRTFRLWLPVLPEILYLRDLKGYERGRFDGLGWPERSGWSLETLVGLSDNPANQLQSPFQIDLSEGGNLAVCGAAGSGKSSFVQTLLFGLTERCSPAEMQLYVIDFSNRSLGVFAGAPHCGGVVYDNEPEKLARLFRMLEENLSRRKQILQGGTFRQYVQSHRGSLPALILAIDNYAGFREKTDGRYEAQLQTMAREGTNYGVFMVLTAGGFGGPDIPNRLADNLRTTVALELGDRYKYGDVLRNIHLDTLPEPGVKGRGIASIQGLFLEFQTALPVEAEDDFRRSEKIAAIFAQMREAWSGILPRAIPEIPDRPTLALLTQNEEYQSILAERRGLPYGYYLEDASVCAVELRESFCFLICGRARIGKTSVLRILLRAAAQIGGSCCLTEFGMRRLKKDAEDCAARYVNDADGLFDYTKELQAEFLRRNKEKRALVESGAEEREIYDAMAAHQPLFLFVDDLASFIAAVYDAEAKYPGMKAFYENAVEKGRLHNIYIIACADPSQAVQLSGKKIYERMAAMKTGVWLGGNVSQQKIFDFSAMPFAEQSKPLKPGIGLLGQDMEHPTPRKVIIPRMER